MKLLRDVKKMEIITGTFDARINGIEPIISEKAEEIYEEIKKECHYNLVSVNKRIDSEINQATFLNNYLHVLIFKEVLKKFKNEIENMTIKAIKERR